MRLVLDILYFFGLLLATPMILWRMIRHGRYRTHIAERLLGRVPRIAHDGPVVWVHAVSLGETNASLLLAKELRTQIPNVHLVISSTTDTGLAAAVRLYGDAQDATVIQWPLDFSLAVATALGRIRPNTAVMMEGEAWPNFLSACQRRRIPTMIVNARISPNKGYPRYKKLGPIAPWLFNKLTRIGCQTQAYADLFASLGVREDKLCVTGMLKYDATSTDGEIKGAEDIVRALGVAGQRLVVAGGTGPGEEEILLDLWNNTLQDKFPDATLVLVPRKPERFDEVARLIESRGYALRRRSELPNGSTAPATDSRTVILVDVMGELKTLYSLASAIFVGRSMVPMGGSDMIEAAALGKPTCFGPHTFNFPQADDLAEHGCVRVQTAEALDTFLRETLADPVAAQAAANGAREFVLAQQGASAHNVEMICDLLKQT
ncbi:MAG: 3-deoxy-D-manno-octulosonic acid transferase [Phycisphaerales bacterium]|nr:3-deoxy-D-manno-octulosonic acid transferase [Phycisphaerales bacterium]